MNKLLFAFACFLFLFIIGCTSTETPARTPAETITQDIVADEISDAIPVDSEQAQAAEAEIAVNKPDPLPSLPSGKRINEWTFNDNADETFFSNYLRVTDNGAYLLAEGRKISSSDGKIYLLDYTADNLRWSYQTKNPAGSLAISGDGSTIVVGAEKIYIFSSGSNEPYLILDPNKITEYDLYDVYDAVAITDDGKYVAVGSDDEDVTIVDTTSGKQVARFYFDQEDLTKVKSYVTSLAISDDARYVAVGGNYIYLYDRQQNKILWVQELTGTVFGSNDVEHISITNDGTVAANNWDHVYVFDKNGLLWEKEFIKLTGSNSQIATSKMSKDGKYVILAHEDKDLGRERGYSFNDASVMTMYNAKDGNVIWNTDFIFNGGKLGMSDDAKYAAVRMDSFDRFIYVYDRDYTKKMRPFRIFKTEDTGLTRDDDLVISADASTIFFQGNGMQYRTMLPGILVDLEDSVPIYTSGQIMDLGIFVTNPSIDRKLEIEVKTYLPQLEFWEIVGDGIFENPEKDRSDIIADFVSSTPPGGGKQIFSTSISLDSRTSSDQVYEIKMLALENPSWLDKLLGGKSIFDGIGDIFDNAFNALEFAIPGNTELEDDLLDLKDANVPAQGFYPLVAAGIVTVKDAETGEVFDSEGFTFVYLAQY